jgi:type IV secretory pathway VirJ component
VRWPVLFGVGKGGALAYLALAQAPENTAAGAVSIGFDDKLQSKLELCEGAPKAGEGMTYAPQKQLSGRYLDCGTITGGGARGIQTVSPGTVKRVIGAPTRTASRQACEICRGRRNHGLMRLMSGVPSASLVR